MKKNIDKIVKIRPWGTIVIEDSILCDGKNYYGMDDGKNIACYTHIHEDHIGGLEDSLGTSQVYSTDITKILASALLMQDREWLKERINFHGLKINETESIRDFEITFKKAHHILGSGQLLVQKKENTILYSSDFIFEGTHIQKDVNYLILDATHGKHSESQDFDDVVEAKKKIIAKTKEIMNDSKKQLNIHASRGTLQLVMSWLRNEIDEEIPFLANKKEINIAKAYGVYGYRSGIIKDDDIYFKQYLKNDHPYIRFLTKNAETDCEIIEPVIPSIRVGASSMTSLENDSRMYIVNLKEHATVSEVCEYVKETNPENIILDNSSRVSNPENATYLKEILEEKGYSVYLSPEKHPNLKKL